MDHFNHRRCTHRRAGGALVRFYGSGGKRESPKTATTAGLLVLLALLTFVAERAATQEQAAGFWLDVPFIGQSADGCGSAAISMVLQYWTAHGATVDSARADAGAIQRSLYSRKARGIFASDMEKYLRESGFSVFALHGTWDDLQRHLQQGRPLIVGLQPGAKKTPLHYVVAVGMDSQTPAIFVHDPARGKLQRIERTEFEKEWQPLGNWTLLTVPPQVH
jgi:predicted double-glycine peptidase